MLFSPNMSTLAEIEAAVEQLPLPQQETLFAFLATRLRRVGKSRMKAARGLKAASLPALEGLPSDLSLGTKERVRASLLAHHAANR